MPKPKNPKTERIRQRLEQIKAAAKSAEEEIEINVPLTESDVTEPVKTAPVKAAAALTADKEFALDGAARFVWLLDGENLTGQYRINDATATVADPVVGYTYSMPLTLAFVTNVRGIGRLVSVDSGALPKMPNRLKLRSGEFVASMAVPISLPRVAWRVGKRIVWSIVQFQPTKSEWRISRIRSVPTQTVYELQQIMRAWLGDVVYNKVKEAIELLATPL